MTPIIIKRIQSQGVMKFIGSGKLGKAIPRPIPIMNNPA